MEHRVLQPPRPRAAPILAMYLVAGGVVSACLWAVVDAGLRSPLNVFQLTLCAAAGPLYLITASATGLTEARYTVAGPLVGSACFVVWLVAVILVRALRRIPVLVHLLLAVFWWFCGVILLVFAGTK